MLLNLTRAEIHYVCVVQAEILYVLYRLKFSMCCVVQTEILYVLCTLKFYTY